VKISSKIQNVFIVTYSIANSYGLKHGLGKPWYKQTTVVKAGRKVLLGISRYRQFRTCT